MGVITVSLPSDGQTIDSADYNTPITTIVNEINGNLDNNNIASGAAIDGSKLANASIPNAKLSTATGEIGAPWQSWTPTLSGRLNNAKWTKVCQYIQIGKTVHFTLSLTASTTTPMDGGSADAIFTLPVTAVALGGVNPEPMGAVRLLDAATAVYAGVVLKVDTTTARIRFFDSAVAAAAFESVITSTAPFTWTTSDEITCQGTYQAA